MKAGYYHSPIGILELKATENALVELTISSNYLPCHRVIASNGSLGGYAYGLETKKRLLDYEK